LRRKGHRRIAWVSKNPAGKVRTRDLFRRRRIWGAVSATVLFGALAEAMLMLPAWPASMLRSFQGSVFPVLAGGFLGIMIHSAWMRRSRFGVARELIRNHARWLIPGESVLIFQGPIETLHTPFALLLESGEIPPAVFVLHPRREGLAGEGISPGETPLNPAQLQESARRLAAEHQADPKPLKDTELLKRLERDRRWVQQACVDLSEANRLEQSLPPSAEWLLDNEYIFESNARDIRLNLPGRFYRQLPALAGGPDRGLPRIYGLARELAARTDLHLDQENILVFIQAYQAVRPLSIGELWAVPQMLRTTLIENIRQLARGALSELREGEFADFWANRLITANRRDPNQLFSILADLTEAQPHPSPNFAAQLMDYLYDEGAALAPVKAWLERTLQNSLSELGIREKNRLTREQLSIGNAFNSLRLLALIDWKECFEKLSGVEQTLQQDPAGIYPRMDFATRDRYRRAVEDLHRGSGQEEDQVARRAVDLAARAVGDSGGDAVDDEQATHVGTYLIGDKRKDLARLIGCREKLRFRALHWAYRHHSAVYFSGLGFFTAVFIGGPLLIGLYGQAPELQLLTALLLLIPASQLALEVVNNLLMRLLPPRILPKMDFRLEGIPDACRTLVVVPMMLVDQRTIAAEAEKLEIRYLANKEANLLFALYSDYTDATQAHAYADAALIQRSASRPSTGAMATGDFSSSTGSGSGANPSKNSSGGSANAGSWRNSMA
jgi:cyclic beta-1,2-glucan synthetase